MTVPPPIERPRSRADPPARGGIPVPAIEDFDLALLSADRRLAFMARALEWITRTVPAGALFWTLDARGQLSASGHVLRQNRRVTVPVARTARRYLRHFQAEDPFRPSRHADSHRAVVCVEDLGGEAWFRQTPMGGAFLPSLGLGWMSSMFLRDGGSIVAGVTLWREASAGDFGAPEVEELRRAHAFLELAYGFARAYRSSETALDCEALLDGRGLTPREKEVARLIADGASNGEIASALFIGVPTVKTHVTHVLAKLGCRTRTQLLVLLRGAVV